MNDADLAAYLAECRELALAEVRRFLPRNRRFGPLLYDLVLDYPFRTGKALRPALCIATCRALGGALESVLPTAAVLELFHNAFLIHDDVEDGSELRRDQPTLHRQHGVPIAVNVGDSMLALALRPLLENTALLGLGKALRILDVVARMARESAEGQALELAWIRRGMWNLPDTEYFRMVYKKTAWYTFVAPLLLGAIAAGAAPPVLTRLRRFGGRLGVAFQIRDDVLNLIADPRRYGKETAGDLWEGKHTLVLLHALRHATPQDRAEAETTLLKPRPPIPIDEREELRHMVEHQRFKTAAEIQKLATMIDRSESIPYARDVGRRWTARARTALRDLDGALVPGPHRNVLLHLVDFVSDRDS